MVILNKLVIVAVGPFAKKLENRMFSDIVGIRQSSSKCPGWRSRTVIHSWTPWSSLPMWPSWALLESWFSRAPWDHFHRGDFGHLGILEIMGTNGTIVIAGTLGVVIVVAPWSHWVFLSSWASEEPS